MTLTIGKVEYRNYGPFEGAEVDFGRLGLTGIEGVLSWQQGSDSSGAGKSKLIGGVAWCLFGRDVAADYKGDDVIRIGSKGGTCVDVELVGDGQSDVRVVRYRKDREKRNRVYLFVDGQDVTRGKDELTQVEIEKILGMDFRTFCTSVAFGAMDDVRSFYAATDTERKQILDRLLGLGVYADAMEAAKRRLAGVRDRLVPLQHQRERLSGAVEVQQTTLEKFRAAEDPEELSFQLDLAKLKTKRARGFLEGAEQRLTAAREEKEQSARAEEERREACKQALEAYYAEGSVHDREARKQEQRAAQAESMIARVDEQLAKASALEGAECPTCHQQVDAGALVVARADLESERKIHERTFTEASEAAAAAHEARKAIQMPEPFAVSASHVTLCEVFEGCEGAKREQEARLREVEAEERAAADLLDRATSQVARIEADIADMRNTLREGDAEIEGLEAQSSQLQFWVEAFGNRGLKSYLIEAEVSQISDRATSYAQRLFGPGTEVRLQATTRLKSSDEMREKLSIDAKIPGCCASYAGASKGQKKRLDLSLLLAFRDVVASRSRGAIQQFFADELFDGLDVSGTETIIELLREISHECPVTLVTHNDAMKSAVDHLITVRHEEKYRATVDGPPKASASKRKRRKRVTT